VFTTGNVNYTAVIKNLVNSRVFKLFAILAILLALVDTYFVYNQTMAYLVRSTLLSTMLLVLCLTGSEQLYVVALAAQMPNLILLLIISISASVPQFFFTGLFNHLVISAIAFSFYWQLDSKFISESDFLQLKSDLQEHENLSMQKLLYFSLIGCLRDQTRVLAQAYHILEIFFKAEKAVIYLSDYQKNLLIPHFRPGTLPDNNFQPILVKPDFWRKHSYDPDKGMLSLIAGKTSLRTLKQLIPESPIDALAAMPLSTSKVVTGLVVIFRQKEENRQFLDPAHFAAFAYVLGSAFENCHTSEVCRGLLDQSLQKSERVENALGKFVSGDVAKTIIDSQNQMSLGGKKLKISVMIADLRGFTRLSGVIPIEGLVLLLNTWFEQACTLISNNGGTIDKFMGDGIMVLFGAPNQGTDDAARSVYTAFRLQKEFTLFMSKVKLPHDYSLGLGISISTGEAVVGNFGSQNRMEYTAIGETVNLAARLEKIAGSGEIIIDKNTFKNLPPDSFKYTVLQNVEIKGVAAQNLYSLHDVTSTHGIEDSSG